MTGPHSGRDPCERRETKNAEEVSVYGKREVKKIPLSQKSKNPSTERRIPRLETLRPDKRSSYPHEQPKVCRRPRYQTSYKRSRAVEKRGTCWISKGRRGVRNQRDRFTTRRKDSLDSLQTDRQDRATLPVIVGLTFSNAEVGGCR